VITSFFADTPGTYVIQLVVNDGLLDSVASTVTITAQSTNQPPIADAGYDTAGGVGDTIFLDGHGSYDPDGDPITYSWNFINMPAGSSAFLDDPTSAIPTFTIDISGIYEVELIVFDGQDYSAPDTVLVRDWLIELVDGTDSMVGDHLSVALDAINDVHIAYHDISNGRLMYAKSDGDFWSLRQADASGDAGTMVSLALDAMGQPRFAYQAVGASGFELRYSTFDGMSFNVQAVDNSSMPGLYASLALDPMGVPHIAHQRGITRTLEYAMGNGMGGFDLYQLDASGDTGYFTSLAIDGAGRPSLAYYDQQNLRVIFLRWDGATWVPSVIASGIYVSDVDLALDDYDYPHIAFTDVTNSQIKVATWNNFSGSFDVFVVDTPLGVDGPIAMTVDGFGMMHVAYHDISVRSLRYGYGIPFDPWEWETVDGGDPDTNMGEALDLALDTEGRPVIAYFDAVNVDVKLARK
jgi:hypothetical protein